MSSTKKLLKEKMSVELDYSKLSLASTWDDKHLKSMGLNTWAEEMEARKNTRFPTVDGRGLGRVEPPCIISQDDLAKMHPGGNFNFQLVGKPDGSIRKVPISLKAFEQVLDKAEEVLQAYREELHEKQASIKENGNTSVFDKVRTLTPETLFGA